MENVILDASALLALLNDEPGSDAVAAALTAASISAVNLSEVVAKLADYGMSETEMRHALDALGLEVVHFDHELAYAAGLLRPATRSLGLALGDRACLALGLRQGTPVLTCDQRWSRADLPLEIRIVR